MRITPVSADVNVGADYPARGIPAAAFQSGAGAAGIEIARGAEDIGRLYQQKANQDAQAEGIYLQSQAELALQNSDAALRATETDGPKYLEQRRKQFQDVIQQVGSTAKNPGAQRVFNAHMQRSLVTMNGHALNYAADLTSKAEVAQLTTTIDNYEQLLNATSPFDTKSIADIQSKMDTAIMLRANALGGVDKATALTVERRHKTLEQVATRHETVDPVGFLQNVDRYTGMDGKALDKLQIKAAEHIDAAEKTDRETAAHFERIEMARIEEERQQKLIWADEMAKNRLLTTDHLRILRNTRTFKTTAEYDHLDEIIRKPPDQPSNQEVLRVVEGNVRGPNPTYRPEDIRRLMADGSLNLKDGMPLIDRLRQNFERREDKAHTERNEKYHRSLVEGQKHLGISGPFESLDPQTKKLDAAFTAELNSRFDAGQDPRQAMYEMMPRYLDAQKKDTRLHFETQMNLLPKDIVGPPPAAREFGESATKIWQEWYSKAANNVEALKGKNPSIYEQNRLRLKEVQDARQRMIDNEIRRAESEAASRGSGGGTGRTPVPSN